MAVALDVSRRFTQSLSLAPQPRLLLRSTNWSHQLHFAQVIADCRAAIAQVLPEAPNEVLPPNMDEFWRTFAEKGLPRHLQKAITTLLDSAAMSYVRSNPDVPRKTKQRLTSSASKNAGAWLNAVPTSPDLTLHDSEFIYAMRHRMGMKPHDDLPHECICHKSLDEDTAHFHSCQQLKSVVTVRHNRLVTMLAKVLRNAGAYVQVEYCPFGDNRSRPDLTVVLPEESYFMDVVVSHPAAPSRKSTEPLAVARQAERDKVNTYGELARAHGSRILAFSVESYGAFGEHATEIIHIIRKALALSQGGDFQSVNDQRLPQRLAVALQKGNALVARAGSMRVRQAQSRLVQH